MVSKLSITIVIGLLAISLIIAAVLLTQMSDQVDVAGVKAGDTFTYSIKGYTDIVEQNESTAASIPASYAELNQTEWYRVNITFVSGPNVQFNTTWHFINGTEIETMGTVNLLTGADNEVFWAIYPKNLKLNDFVSPEGSDGAIVNETETRYYKDTFRDTNIITLQNEFTDTSDLTFSRTFDDYIYIHFDKATGMLVELRDMRLYSDPGMILTTQWELIDSNVWAVT